MHAVVSMISPMKKGGTCSYFDGELTDGKARMCLFGFDGDVRRKLMEEGSSSPVVISNCEVKKNAGESNWRYVLITFLIIFCDRTAVADLPFKLAPASSRKRSSLVLARST